MERPPVSTAAFYPNRSLLRCLLYMTGVLITCRDVTSTSEPESGWHEFRGNMYGVESGHRQNYLGAMDECHEYGGSLALLKSHEINSFVSNLLVHSPTERQYFFFGLTDILEERQFRWIDGEALDDSASLWDNGEPNDKGNQDCAALISTRASATSSPSHGRWDDHNCNVQRGYICERPVEHPQLSSPPFPLEIGSHFARVGWRAWETSMDIGDGPVVGYIVHVGFVAARVSQTTHSNSSEDFEKVIRGLQPGKEYHIGVSVVRNSSSDGMVDGLTGPSIIINSSSVTDALTESLDILESHQAKSVAAWVLLTISFIINFFLLIIIIYLCKLTRVKAKKQSTKVELLASQAKKSVPQPYQDLTFPLGRSDMPNPVYQDIAAGREEEGISAQVTYVNTACGSTPKTGALYETPDCCQQSIPDDGKRMASK